jgi:hypothetical protein
MLAAFVALFANSDQVNTGAEQIGKVLGGLLAMGIVAFLGRKLFHRGKK